MSLHTITIDHAARRIPKPFPQIFLLLEFPTEPETKASTGQVRVAGSSKYPSLSTSPRPLGSHSRTTLQLVYFLLFLIGSFVCKSLIPHLLRSPLPKSVDTTLVAIHTPCHWPTPMFPSSISTSESLTSLPR
jgi:hypothetical protein